MRRAVLLGAACALAGCASRPVVVVDPAKKCEPAPVLMERCEAPVLLPPNLTFGQLLDNYLADRDRLRRCALQRDAIAQAIATCNAAIDVHNDDLQRKLKAPS